jgi:Zn-dependent alcohol dehydrogenase
MTHFINPAENVENADAIVQRLMAARDHVSECIGTQVMRQALECKTRAGAAASSSA